ncbi:hypothetical protein A5875_001874, partial [Enterococcus sp. 3H8_DIV0648]
ARIPSRFFYSSVNKASISASFVAQLVAKRITVCSSSYCSQKLKATSFFSSSI